MSVKEMKARVDSGHILFDISFSCSNFYRYRPNGILKKAHFHRISFIEIKNLEPCAIHSFYTEDEFSSYLRGRLVYYYDGGEIRLERYFNGAWYRVNKIKEFFDNVDS